MIATQIDRNNISIVLTDDEADLLDRAAAQNPRATIPDLITDQLTFWDTEVPRQEQQAAIATFTAIVMSDPAKATDFIAQLNLAKPLNVLQ